MDASEEREYRELMAGLSRLERCRFLWYLRWLLWRQRVQHVWRRGIVLLHESRLALDLTYYLIEEEARE